MHSRILRILTYISLYKREGTGVRWWRRAGGPISGKPKEIRRGGKEVKMEGRGAICGKGRKLDGSEGREGVGSDAM